MSIYYLLAKFGFDTADSVYQPASRPERALKSLPALRLQIPQVLSMDADDEQERAENAAEDVHALVGRLHKRNHILSQLSCVCCEEERHAGNQASARPDLQPIV